MSNGLIPKAVQDSLERVLHRLLVLNVKKKGHNIRRCPLNHAADAVPLEGSGTQPPLNSNKCRKCKRLEHNVRTYPLIASGTSNTQATKETHVSVSTTITEVDNEPSKNMVATKSNSDIFFNH